MIYTIGELTNLVTPIAEKYHIPVIYLFGSYARGTATDASDIDLLIDTTGTSLTSLFALGALYCDLTETLKKQVDLITVSSLQQKAQMPSDLDFSEAVINERVKLCAAA